MVRNASVANRAGPILELRRLLVKFNERAAIGTLRLRERPFPSGQVPDQIHHELDPMLVGWQLGSANPMVFAHEK